MKIKLFVVVLFFFKITTLFGQVPNIKVTDIYGNYYMSTDILAEGKYIFIDFFTNGCSSCQYVSPKIDTVFKNLGCNCGDIFFMALNASPSSSDESVYNFCRTFGITIPAVSAEGGSYNISEMFDIPWTPYFIMISPENLVVYDTSFFIEHSDILLDTLLDYGATIQQCKNNDILYLELQNFYFTFEGIVDKENKIVEIPVPDDLDLSTLTTFLITSPNSTVYYAGNLLDSEYIEIDLSDSLDYFTIVAEDETITEIWTIKVIKNLNISEKHNTTVIYPNPSSGIVNFNNFDLIKNISIFASNGELISKYKPTQSEQNYSVMENGTYLIQIETQEKIINQKLIIKK